MRLIDNYTQTLPLSVPLGIPSDPFTNFSNNPEDLIEPVIRTNSTKMNILITLFPLKLLFNYTKIAPFEGSLHCLNEVF
jgi:hypothetical protein